MDPSPTSTYACDQIPIKASKFAGTNTSFYYNHQLDTIMRQSDAELDLAERHQLISQVNVTLRQNVVALPLYPFINITGWRADKIAGPIGHWNEAT